MFDFSFCVHCIHHFGYRLAFFTEAFRLLGDRGTLCIATESEAMIRARHPDAQYFPDAPLADVRRYPPISELERMARTAGFREWRETSLEVRVPLASADAYEAKAFSSLHFVPEELFEAGLRRLKADLARGPMLATSAFALLWATR